MILAGALAIDSFTALIPIRHVTTVVVSSEAHPKWDGSTVDHFLKRQLLSSTAARRGA
jgi:hypothetical protein